MTTRWQLIRMMKNDRLVVCRRNIRRMANDDAEDIRVVTRRSLYLITDHLMKAYYKHGGLKCGNTDLHHNSSCLYDLGTFSLMKKMDQQDLMSVEHDTFFVTAAAAALADARVRLIEAYTSE
jgi:hypothetical protein